MLPNWECDTDKAKGLAKLGLKSSAAAATTTAYWALQQGGLAFRIISRLRQTAVLQSWENRCRHNHQCDAVGLGFSSQLPAQKGGCWQKNNMNSGEGHELNGSMGTQEEEGCRRLCTASRSLRSTHDPT